jgi:hypothetical protein
MKNIRSMILENRILRRLFGPMREEATGDLRKLRNAEIHNLYSSPNIIHPASYPVGTGGSFPGDKAAGA